MFGTSQESGASASQAALQGQGQLYAALDLGTNNCRLLVANAYFSDTGSPVIKVCDSFSRIVRLGEGVSETGRLSEDAMERTLQALKACEKKLSRYQISGMRFVATEACRRAANGSEFLSKVQQETGISIDIISTEEEARLAFMGCSSLLEEKSDRAIVFDIGGGSTELMWVDTKFDERGQHEHRITDWLSIGFGVMNLADKFGGSSFSDMAFEDMVALLMERLTPFDAANRIGHTIDDANVQLLSTSGTVTTLAAIHLDLPRYDRSRIDGITLPIEDIRHTTKKLLEMRPSERFHHPCIGADRADFIISGCAIFEAISRMWPTGSITIADRGVREGIILTLLNQQS